MGGGGVMRKVLISLLLTLTASCCHVFQLDTEDVIEIGSESAVRIKTEHGYCSGFALDNETIATAAHCVTTPNAYIEWKDRVILSYLYFMDVDNDIAILKSITPVDGLIGLQVSNGKVRRGEQLVTVGFPGWSNVQLTYEIGRVIDSNDKVIIATDACLPGDSGAAVLNSYGLVVGICSRVSPRVILYGGADILEHSHRDLGLIIPISALQL
jgi:hypothetical protein